jgi:hypothetical protein
MDLNYLKSKAVYVITALISIFLVMYIGFQMKITADDEIYTEVVDIKKMSLFTEISGYMFLDEEELYLEESEGVWIPEVSAGTFVDKGKMLGAVYGEDDVPIAQRIAAIDEKILLLETCMKANQGIIGSKEYEKAVNNSYLSLMSAADEGDLFNVRQEMRNWLLSKGKRDIAISVITSFKNEINTLKKQSTSSTTSNYATTTSTKGLTKKVGASISKMKSAYDNSYALWLYADKKINATKDVIKKR